VRPPIPPPMIANDFDLIMYSGYFPLALLKAFPDAHFFDNRVQVVLRLLKLQQV
jgi:hypothetical protein